MHSWKSGLGLRNKKTKWQHITKKNKQTKKLANQQYSKVSSSATDSFWYLLHRSPTIATMTYLTFLLPSV